MRFKGCSIQEEFSKTTYVYALMGDVEILPWLTSLWLQSILDEFLNCFGAEARPWKDSGAVRNIAERGLANPVVNISVY